jgi:tetratricopeptide (TPR) repeat protein
MKKTFGYVMALCFTAAAFLSCGTADGARQTAPAEELSAGQYIDRGITYAESGDYDRAIADYTAALRINPKES